LERVSEYAVDMDSELLTIVGVGLGGVAVGAALCWHLLRRSSVAEDSGEITELDTGDGADLMRYPDQLALLERRLERSCLEAEDQVRHLKRQRDRVGAKGAGESLSARYDADAVQLESRQAQLQRVLGLVWRTRSILILRVRVARVARACPRMIDLPEIPEGEANWDDVADSLRVFRRSVRDSMSAIGIASSDLALSLPSVPSRAQLEGGEQERIREELDRARASLDLIGRRMEQLSDTVAYLADRCRTRGVVEAAPLEISTEGEAEGLLHDVRAALQELDGLSDLVDRRLAEDALDNLAAGVGQLEKEGLDAQAESDAAVEVDRLLEQFPR